MQSENCRRTQSETTAIPYGHVDEVENLVKLQQRILGLKCSPFDRILDNFGRP